jgi:hypothetical protein
MDNFQHFNGNQNYMNNMNNSNNMNNINNMNNTFNNNNNQNNFNNFPNVNNNNYNYKSNNNNYEMNNGFNFNNNNYNNINNYQNMFNNINNLNNMNQNHYPINQQELFQKFSQLLKIAEEHLSNKENVNYYLYEQYCLQPQNIDKNNDQTQNLYFSSVTEKTQNPDVNKITTLQVTASYKEEYVDFKKISLGEEKRTAVKVFGTSLPKRDGEFILDFLEKLKLGKEDGQNVYDIVYVPKKKENSNHKYFMVNFRKSSYILNFREALMEALDKKEAENIIFSWHKKQDEKLRVFLDNKRRNNKCKDFIKFLD